MFFIRFCELFIFLHFVKYCNQIVLIYKMIAAAKIIRILNLSMIHKQNIVKFKELVESGKSITIICHTNPDGDTVGSALALYHFLSKKKNKVTVVVPNDLPEFLKWMNGADKIVVAFHHQKKVKAIIEQAEVIIIVDFNSLHRLDDIATFVTDSKATKVVIDHHLQPEEFANITFSETSVSSTSELIYLILSDMNELHNLTIEIAEGLYVGILTDTGSFSYSLSEKTFIVASELLKIGINATYINQMIYDTYSEKRLRLLGYCLSDKLEVMQDYHVAYISLTKEELRRFSHQTGDTEGVVNFALSIKGINLAAIFVERTNQIRLSLRSKGSFNVNKLARKYFNGGGHKNAAGGHLDCTLDEAILKFIVSVKKNQVELAQSL